MPDPLIGFRLRRAARGGLRPSVWPIIALEEHCGAGSPGQSLCSRSSPLSGRSFRLSAGRGDQYRPLHAVATAAFALYSAWSAVCRRLSGIRIDPPIRAMAVADREVAAACTFFVRNAQASCGMRRSAIEVRTASAITKAASDPLAPRVTASSPRHSGRRYRLGSGYGRGSKPAPPAGTYRRPGAHRCR